MSVRIARRLCITVWLAVAVVSALLVYTVATDSEPAAANQTETPNFHHITNPTPEQIGTI